MGVGGDRDTRINENDGEFDWLSLFSQKLPRRYGVTELWAGFPACMFLGCEESNRRAAYFSRIVDRPKRPRFAAQ